MKSNADLEVAGSGMREPRRPRWMAPLVAALVMASPLPARAAEGDFVMKRFAFQSGETMPDLRIHYTTLGTPRKTDAGEITNGILILHGLGGSERQLLARAFSDELYGPGAPLDTTEWFLILPDGIGHGRSSKPSDSLRTRFPHYAYDDMVRAQFRLVSEHFNIPHMRLVMGTSMGGMPCWLVGGDYPTFMDALMPLACLPVEIVGRNRLWRQMVVDAIRQDPDWKGGDYKTPPKAGLRTAIDLLLVAGSAPALMQKTLPTRDSVERYLNTQIESRMATTDANDLIYQIEASRDYNPAPKLESIVAPVMFVNSGDDFINPPDLGIAEREIKRVKRGTFVLIPASDQTRGHGTHTWAKFWKDKLTQLMKDSRPADSR